MKDTTPLNPDGSTRITPVDLKAEPENEKPHEEQQKKSRTDFEIITSAELDSGDYSIRFLIDRMLVAEQPCIVAGMKKTLKTSLMVDLGISLACGGFFLGKFRVLEPCRVGIMSGESGLGVLQETARRICRAAGKRLSELDNLFWSPDLPIAGEQTDMRALDKLLAELELNVLVLDPAFLCIPGDDANNLMKQGKLLRSLNDVCGNHRTTLIIAHHMKNTGKKGFTIPDLGDIAWAGFQEWARQWLLLSRRERYEEGSGLHRMWFSVGGSAGQSGLWCLDVEEGTNTALEGREWVVTVESTTDVQREAEKRKARAAQQVVRDREQKVRNVLKQCPDGETARRIRELAGMNSENTGTALVGLMQMGLVECCQVKKHTRTQDGYRLTERGSNDA